MRILQASFVIESALPYHDMLYQLEKAGRTAYKSELKITPESAERFVQSIVKRGHESVLEHQNVTVRVICDRGVTHEIVRHRLFAYTMESTRYCNYAKDKFDNEITVIEPIFWEPTDPKYLVWKRAMEYAEQAYMELIELGAKPEEARSVLPHSIKTEIVMTSNIREWRHFFRMRIGKECHPQMRELSIPMLTEFKKRFGILFSDIN